MGPAFSTDRQSMFSGYEGLMNEHHALVLYQKDDKGGKRSR